MQHLIVPKIEGKKQSDPDLYIALKQIIDHVNTTNQDLVNQIAGCVKK